jgi:outer membrane protein TolC
MKHTALVISYYGFALLILPLLTPKVYSKTPEPITLTTLINKALEHNPEILHARQQIEKATGTRIRARSVLYPKARIEARLEMRDQDLLKQDPSRQQGWNDYWIIQLAIQHSLYSGGANPRKIQIANLQLTNEFLSLQETTQKIISQIKEAYLTIILQSQEIQALENASAALIEEIKRQRALFDAGRTTRFNILRTEVAYNNLQPDLQALKIDLLRHQLLLTQLTGQSPLSPLPTPQDFSFDQIITPDLPLNLEQIIETALRTRAQNRQLENITLIANHQIQIERSALLPKIDAFIGTQTRQNESTNSSQSFFSTTQEFAVGILGRWDIFDGFLSKGKIREAQAQAQIATIKKHQWQQDLKTEAKQITTEIQSLHQILQNQKQNLSIAQEALRLAKLSEENGYATLLDVLQANVDLTRARINELQARHKLLIAYTRLERLIGLPKIHIDDTSLKISND